MYIIYDMLTNKNANLAKKYSASFIRINKLSYLWSLLSRRVWHFRLATYRKTKIASKFKKIKDICNTSRTSDEATARIYDLEYANNDGTHYMYLNSLLFPEYWNLITGYNKTNLLNKKIIDIGAGSNEMLRFLATTFSLKRNDLYGVDISEESKKIIINDEMNGYVGRIEQIHFPDNSFDVTFLTYFIDYDTDQFETFKESIRITKSNGKIVLEGKFPVMKYGVLANDSNKYNYITKGCTATEDLELITEAFMKIGLLYRRKIILERIVQSRRFVFSCRYGLWNLPSYFLVFRVE